MKKVFNFLPLAAILVGSSLAVASNSLYNTPNVKNTAPGSATPQWEEIGPGETVNCNDNHYRICKAFMDEEGTVVPSSYVYGDRY